MAATWNVRVRIQHIEPAGRHIAVLKLHTRLSLGIVDVRHCPDADKPLEHFFSIHQYPSNTMRKEICVV